MDPELIGPDSPKVKEEGREKEAYHTGTGQMDLQRSCLLWMQLRITKLDNGPVSESL